MFAFSHWRVILSHSLKSSHHISSHSYGTLCPQRCILLNHPNFRGLLISIPPSFSFSHSKGVLVMHFSISLWFFKGSSQRNCQCFSVHFYWCSHFCMQFFLKRCIFLVFSPKYVHFYAHIPWIHTFSYTFLFCLQSSELCAFLKEGYIFGLHILWTGLNFSLFLAPGLASRLNNKPYKPRAFLHMLFN